MNRKIIFIGTLILTLIPVSAHAQFSGIRDMIVQAGVIIDLLTILVAGVALLAFFWGLAKFIFAQGNEGAKTDAKKVMGWSLIALFIMMSVWGIVRFMQSELLPSTNFNAPCVPAFGGDAC